MKLQEITEGLTAIWSENRIRELSTAKLKALRINAVKASDQKVLDLIDKINNDRLEIQKQAKEAAKEAAKEKAKERAVKKGNSFEFGDLILSKEDLSVVARKFEEAVGNTFPDGDPIDQMAPWIRKKFGSPAYYFTGEILDKAVELNLNSKSYTDYMAQTWDDYVADGNFPDLEDRPNPWK